MVFWVDESADIKRARVASKGKQRAEDSFEYSENWNGEEDEEGGRFFGDGLTSEQKEIINILNHDSEDQNEAPSENSAGAEKLKLTEVKKNCLNLERAINKNREMRTKYENNPEKYVPRTITRPFFLLLRCD
jgi:beta-catenin-like protein 1